MKSFDLDYKVALYGRGEPDKQNLAGDVAAMANTAGGVIVLGVAEDDQAPAAAAPGVTVSESERGRILQIFASRVSPHVDLDVITVDHDPPDQGYIVIAVPRSPTAPHAVLVNRYAGWVGSLDMPATPPTRPGGLRTG